MPGVKFADYNDLDSVKKRITDKTCAILFETVQGEGGIYPATKEFMEGVRKLCDEHDILLILDEIQRDHITDHVKEITPYLEEKLDELVASYDFLTARRGLGLMQGVVSEKPVGQIAAKALEEGLIVITAGSDVLRFVPPLIIEKQHVDEMIGKLKKALDQM